MNFNSIEFLGFLPVVFLAYWFIFSRSKLSQNALLLIASYFFYASWNVYFVALLAFSTCLNYYAGLAIDNAAGLSQKKFWMRLAVLINTALLGYFKYCNFFMDSIDALHLSGIRWNTGSLKVLLPIGISFYTFHGLSYVLDIYYKRIKADKNFIDYALFVSFFPLLLAGPIERATHLLPQLKQKRVFSYAQGVAGLRLILWGMFKKVVIADSLAPNVNYIFRFYEHVGGISLIFGIIGFSFQVYCDFSGYSDIARGIAKLLGIEVFRNFNFPYFSRNIGEYWSKWHISLSTWLNDYVYTPLAVKFRNAGKPGIFAAIFITFIISGFWHGAAWHFVVWGALNGLYYLPLVFSNKSIRSITGNKYPAITPRDTGSILLTYTMVCIALVFFRAGSVSIAFMYLSKMCTSIIHHPVQLFHIQRGATVLVYVVPFMVAEILLSTGKAQHILSNKIFRIFVYIISAAVTLFYANFFNERGFIDFIYFQF